MMKTEAITRHDKLEEDRRATAIPTLTVEARFQAASMLSNLIPRLICAMSLRGARGVGVVSPGTVEEDIWCELGALPRSWRNGRF